jgi:hypothetical protein
MKSIQRILLATLVGITVISCNEPETLEQLTEETTHSSSRSGDYVYIAGAPSPNLNVMKKADPQDGSGATTAFSGGNTIKTVGIDLSNVVYYTTVSGSTTYFNSYPGSLSAILQDNLGADFDPEEIEWCNGEYFAIKGGNLTLHKIVVDPSGLNATATPCSTSMFTGLPNRSTKKSLCRQGSTLKVVRGSSSGGTSLDLYTLNTSTGAATFVSSLSGTGFSYTSTANINSYYDATDLYIGIYDSGIHTLWKYNGTSLVSTPPPSALPLGTDCSWMPMP